MMNSKPLVPKLLIKPSRNLDMEVKEASEVGYKSDVSRV